jgi:hypothetical protein
MTTLTIGIRSMATSPNSVTHYKVQILTVLVSTPISYSRAILQHQQKQEVHFNFQRSPRSCSWSLFPSVSRRKTPRRGSPAQSHLMHVWTLSQQTWTKKRLLSGRGSMRRNSHMDSSGSKASVPLINLITCTKMTLKFWIVRCLVQILALKIKI